MMRCQVDMQTDVLARMDAWIFGNLGDMKQRSGANGMSDAICECRRRLRESHSDGAIGITLLE